MHRAITRVIGRTCRKWRESDCPIVTGEEVRKGGHKKEEKFIPEEKYSFGDAVGWTAGLVLAYEFTYGRKRGFTTLEERPQQPVSFTPFSTFENYKCPFRWPRTATTQPILSQHVLEINSYPRHKGSIDVTPFIQEDRGDYSCLQSNVDNHRRQDEESVQFASEQRSRSFSRLPQSIPLTTKKVDTETQDDKRGLSVSERLTGDLLGMLGAFKFMTCESKGMNSRNAADHIDYQKSFSPEEPPMSALELLEKGEELGSARALYNIGVAYDRMKDYQLAREYYCRAADLGHPLATYNCAVYMLKDGDIQNGLSMMKISAEGGVSEAKDFFAKKTFTQSASANECGLREAKTTKSKS